MSFVADLKFAFRSFTRAKGLALTVIVTLALGIGANAAIFSVVRSVLLRPLVNRYPERLVYIRQTARGIETENLTFSMPEISDFKSRVRSISAFGDFSTVDFTLITPGREPRVVTAGVVNGSFFEVMGLHPVHGRLLNGADDRPGAEGVAVLTHRFWTTAFGGDPAVIGKTIRLGPGTATIVGVLEPSVPYPAETQLIANVVTSPHHLGRTREFGIRLAFGSSPRDLRIGVLRDGVRIVAIGIAAGAAGGYALARVAGAVFEEVRLPGALRLIGAAAVLSGAAIVASLMPAARASRVDVLEALGSD